jgi:AAA domain
MPASRTDSHDLDLPPAKYPDELGSPDVHPDAKWLWHGYIARGNVTLFTSPEKSGKTTVINGLLQVMAEGGKFLDRPAAAAKVLIVTEERRDTWHDRLRRMPLGRHCRFQARPWRRRPTAPQWEGLIEREMEVRAAGQLDLIVIDPLSRFVPGAGDGVMNSLELMLDPLKSLTDSGVGVLILHHPRLEKSEEGRSARGPGGLLATVDIIVELKRYGSLQSDKYRRKLFAVSRFPETPENLVYEWDPKTTQFTSLGDPFTARFRENWETVLGILQKRKRAATHEELLMDWPADQPRPTRGTLYEWLNRAYEAKLLRRIGFGRKAKPYRYRLENEDDAYLDRGELPPLRLDPREIIG